MNLISCNGCGVILDKDKLNFPSEIWKEDGSIDDQLGCWDQQTKQYSAFISCPVCDTEIFK